MYDLARLVSLLRKRWKAATLLFGILAAAGIVAALLYPRTYVATSQVLVQQPAKEGDSTATYPQIAELLAWNPDTTIETYVALALQPDVAAHVVRRLHLRVDPNRLLARYLNVAPLTNSNVIAVSAYWRDPRVASAIANAVATEFVDRQRKLAASQAAQAADSLAIALARAQADLSSAENALTSFESTSGVADATGQTGAIIAAIGDIQSKTRGAELDRSQAQGQLRSVGTQIAATKQTVEQSRTIDNAPVADEIDKELSEERVQLSQLEQQFTGKYPDVIAARRQIASLEAAMAKAPRTRVASTTVALNPVGTTLDGQAATLEAQIAGQTSELRTLHAQEDGLESQLRAFPGLVSRLSSLQRRAKSAETIYDSLQSSYFNAIVAKNMAVSDLSIVQRASPELAEVRPSLVLAIAIMLVIAALVTIAAIVLLDWRRRAQAALPEPSKNSAGRVSLGEPVAH